MDPSDRQLDNLRVLFVSFLQLSPLQTIISPPILTGFIFYLHYFAISQDFFLTRHLGILGVCKNNLEETEFSKQKLVKMKFGNKKLEEMEFKKEI